jgi:predicted naringenin-chalcone synthase
MSAAILSVATAVPEHRLEAPEALHHLRTYFPQLAKLEPDEASLGTRYTCEPVEDLLAPRGLTDLGRAYLHHARRLAVSSARDALAGAGLSGREIDLVITVSCTGYIVPSLDVHMAEELGLRRDVIRLPITELGCSGGAAAIAAAQRHIAAFPEDKVLAVAVEVPSLSFQRSDQSLDNLTACLVFGDGAGAAVIGRTEPGARLEVVRTATHLLPGTADLLGFDLRDGGFYVVLDRRLTRVLKRELGPIVRGFLPAADFYAVHAAGPRIFAAVQETLGLEPRALDISRRVFADVGNTSSAAIFFALDRVMRSEEGPGTGLGLALGPGVSVEMMELVRN